jgi:hypothetical protein
MCIGENRRVPIHLPCVTTKNSKGFSRVDFNECNSNESMARPGSDSQTVTQ